MLYTIVSSSNDYDVESTDSGNVVSCIGNFSYDIICMGEHHIHIADTHKVVKEYHKINNSVLDSFTSDDFGPQKVCLNCGSRVEEFEPEIINSRVAYWRHGVNQQFQGMTLPPKGVRSQLSLTYKEEEVTGWKCPEGGLLADDQVVQYNALNHNEMDMDDLREVFKNLKGKDAKWLHDNASILKTIYKDHADDAGKNSKEECCEVEEENIAITQEGELISNAAEFSKEATEMDKEACSLFGAFNDKMGWNHSIVWKSMLFGKEFAVKELESNKTHLTEEEYDYLSELITDALDNPIRNEFVTHNYGVRFIKLGNRYEFGKINIRNVSKTKYPKLVADKEIKRNTHLQAKYEFKMEGVKKVIEEFNSLKVKTTDSEKYVKKTVFDFNMEGRKITLIKGKTATNWLNPDHLNLKDLNRAIVWIIASYKKGDYKAL